MIEYRSLDNATLKLLFVALEKVNGIYHDIGFDFENMYAKKEKIEWDG